MRWYLQFTINTRHLHRFHEAAFILFKLAAQCVAHAGTVNTDFAVGVEIAVPAGSPRHEAGARTDTAARHARIVILANDEPSKLVSFIDKTAARVEDDAEQGFTVLLDRSVDPNGIAMFEAAMDIHRLSGLRPPDAIDRMRW